MSKCVTVTLTQDEEALVINRVVAKIAKVEIAGSVCVACGKVLGAQEIGLRGYASGEELALCRGCASHVNTEAAINKAMKDGHDVSLKALIKQSIKSEKNHGPQ